MTNTEEIQNNAANANPIKADDVIASGRFLSLVRDHGWEYVERTNKGGVVAIIAITAKDELVITEQFRPPLGKQVFDLPAGLIGDEPSFTNEDACQAARRELIEECGYAARKYARLFDRPTSPGMSNEVVSFVHAENLKKISAGGGVGDENIKVHLVPLNEVNQWIKLRERNGDLIDPKIDVALSYVARRVLSEKQDIHLNAPLISRDKVVGMMLGVALGDALGCAVETLSQEKISENFGRIEGFVRPLADSLHGLSYGEYSDDTQLTVSVMQAIIDAHGFDMDTLAQAHVKAMSESAEGWGGTTKDAINKIAAGVPWQKSGETITPDRGMGNGVAMKIAPLAALLAESNVDSNSERKIITAFTQMTHANNLAVASAFAQCRALTYCLNSNPDDFQSADFIETVLDGANAAHDALPLSRSPDALIERLGLLHRAGEMSDKEIVEACDGGTCFVVNSIPQTLLLFLRNPQNILPVFDAVNAGGDTDTNASMAAALLGALHGESIFPKELLGKIKNVEGIREIANKFCDQFGVD